MTETGLDHLGVLTLLDQKSGVCVPEVVKPKRPEVVTAALAFRRLRLEFRPLVLVYAQLREEGSDLVELLIANVGREPASDVRISWSQRLPNLIPRGGQDINDLPLWSHIPVLVPGSPLRLDLGRGADLLKESIMRYEATVEYSQAGGRGRSFSDPAVIDIEVFKGTSIAKRGPRSGTS